MLASEAISVVPMSITYVEKGFKGDDRPAACGTCHLGLSLLQSQAREILRTSTPDLLLLGMDSALTPLTCRAKEKWIQATAAEVLRRLGRPVVSEAPEENTLLDELVMEVASPRTRDLLTDYAEHNKARCTSRRAKVLLAAACCRECLGIRSTAGLGRDIPLGTFMLA